MNNNPNTDSYFTGSDNRKSFFGFLQHLFAVKGILNFDVFQYSNTYHEKLAIIYANIRV